MTTYGPWTEAGEKTVSFTGGTAPAGWAPYGRVFRTFGGPPPWSDGAIPATWQNARRGQGDFWWWDGPLPGDGTAWHGGPAYQPPIAATLNRERGPANMNAGWRFRGDGAPYYETGHALQYAGSGLRVLSVAQATTWQIIDPPIPPQSEWPEGAAYPEVESGPEAEILELKVRSLAATLDVVGDEITSVIDWIAMPATFDPIAGPGYALTADGTRYARAWMTAAPGSILGVGQQLLTQVAAAATGSAVVPAGLVEQAIDWERDVAAAAAAGGPESPAWSLRGVNAPAGLVMLGMPQEALSEFPPYLPEISGPVYAQAYTSGMQLEWTVTVRPPWRWRWVFEALERRPPLRQVQRDDGLALGAPRQVSSRSVQSSIRQIGYQ